MSTGADWVDFVRDIGELANSAGQLSQSLPGVRAYARGFCRIFGGTLGGQVFQSLNINTICTPYWNEDGRGPATVGTPPFTGGQCDFLNYDVTASPQFPPSGPLGPSTNTNNPGPISLEEINEPSSRGQRLVDGNGVVLLSASTAPPAEPARLVNISVAVTGGGPDTCGDPDSPIVPGPGYGGEQFDQPQTVTGPDGNDYEIVVFTPTENPDGGVSIPVSIDGVNFNFGSEPSGGVESSEPDYNNPSNPSQPGPGGGSDGSDNPDDGLDVTLPVAAVRVVITQEPVNSSREVGGSENVFIPGTLSDAGWFRWRVNGGFTPIVRLLSRDNLLIFSPGICAEADGYQVKFSPGFNGSATEFTCSTQQETA